MELKILEEKENPFFERKEFLILVKHENEATPSRESLAEEIEKMLKIKKEQIEIDYIRTKSGMSESLAKVKVYSKPIKREKNEAQTSKSE